jgi:hypothetical protein
MVNRLRGLCKEIQNTDWDVESEEVEPCDEKQSENDGNARDKAQINPME